MRLNAENTLIVLLVSVIAAMPFIHYVVSAVMLIITGIVIMSFGGSRRAVLANREMCVIASLIVLISTVGSLISGNVIGLAVTLGILLILICASYTRSVMTSELTEMVYFIVGVGGIFTLIIVIIQRIAERNPGYRPTGWQWNANYLGAVAVLSALVCMICFFERCGCDGKRKITGKRVFFATSFLADCLTILICESRSSLLAIMASVIAYMFLRKWYIICAASVVCGAGIWLLGYLKPEFFGWANSLVYVFTQRYDIWMEAFNSFIAGPIQFLIGRGPMTYHHVWEAEGMIGADHAHNILFDTLINVGVTGFVFYVFLIGNFAKNTFAKYTAREEEAFRISLIALVAIFVQGIADVTIMWHQSACLFVLMCAARSPIIAKNEIK